MFLATCPFLEGPHVHPGILFQALKDGLYQTWDLDHEVVIANMAHGCYTEINLLYAPIAARHVHSRDKKKGQTGTNP